MMKFWHYLHALNKRHEIEDLKRQLDRRLTADDGERLVRERNYNRSRANRLEEELARQKGARDFRLDWRDQTIRRLTELLKISEDQLVETKKDHDDLFDKLFDECVKVDELKDEVDGLRAALSTRHEGCISPDDAKRLRSEVDRLKAKGLSTIGEFYRFID
jgi:hypothetical protein